MSKFPSAVIFLLRNAFNSFIRKTCSSLFKSLTTSTLSCALSSSTYDATDAYTSLSTDTNFLFRVGACTKERGPIVLCQMPSKSLCSSIVRNKTGSCLNMSFKMDVTEYYSFQRNVSCKYYSPEF